MSYVTLQKEGAKLGPLESVSLREQARRAIWAGIITGELVSGEVYSARLLAERLGVSATPVREAMLDLAGDGLLEPVRNKGFRVVQLADRDLEEIFEVRMLLEAPSARRLAGRLEPAVVRRLSKLVRDMEIAAKRGDLTAFLEDDRGFHLSLLEEIGNRRLAGMVATLRDQARLFGLPLLAQSGELEGSAREHRDILEAIASGDGRRAEALTKRHLEHTRGIWAGRSER